MSFIVVPIAVLRRSAVCYVSVLLGAFLQVASPVGATPSAPSPDTGDAAPSAARAYLVKGTVEEQLEDYKEAISYFEAALDQAPEAPALLQALADAHAAQGDLSSALFYARKARRHGPGVAYYHRRLAELQRRAGEPQSALQTYRTLLDRFPNHWAAYRGLAELQAELNRPNDALDTYETFLSRGPRTPVSVLQNMLPLYRQTGDEEAVGKTLRALVTHRPYTRRYRRFLGKHYAETGRPEAALDLLAPLAEHQPKASDLQRLVRQLSRKTDRAQGGPPADTTTVSSLSLEQRVDRARALLAQSEASSDSSHLRSAECLLREVLDESPGHVPALRLRARLHAQRGNHERAGELLKRAVDEAPRTPSLWIRAARAYRTAHQYEPAASVAEEGLLLFPGEADLARIAAVARLRVHSPTRALGHFRTALDLLPNDSAQTRTAATLRAGQALAYTHLNRPEKASEALDEAVAIAPGHPPVLRAAAYSLALRCEQLDRALTLAQRAAEHAPSDPYVLHALGWVHAQRGTLEAARRFLQLALDAGPPTVSLLEHLGDVEHALGNEAAARTYWQRALDRAPDRSSVQQKLEQSFTPQ